MQENRDTVDSAHVALDIPDHDAAKDDVSNIGATIPARHLPTSAGGVPNNMFTCVAVS